MELYKILIVDDEEEVRTGIIKKMPWEELGYQVIGDAENGEDALEKVALLEPDLILTDIKMPYMDGLTLAERVKKDRSSIEIVFFSGFDEFEYAKQAIKLNVIEYILKPVNVEELKEILQKLKKRLDKKIEEKRNIQILRDNYQKTLPIMREYFLNELVHGNLNEEEIFDGFRRYGIRGEVTNKWAVIAVEIEIPRNEAGQSAINFHKEKELLPLSVKQVINEKMNQKYQYTMLGGTVQSIYMLVSFGEEDTISSLIQNLYQVCYECKRMLDLDITAGIGEAYQNVSQIHMSYEEAKNAIGYRATLEKQLVIYIKDVEKMDEEQLYLDEHDEGELLQAVKFGNVKRIEYVIDKLITKMERAKVHSSQQQIYLLTIFNVIAQMIQKHELNTVAIWGREKDYFEILSKLKDSANVKNFLVNTCISLQENINRERKDTIQSTIMKAQDYIEENFSNPDLSVEAVCEHLHISPTYFSTIFKKETGENYVSWLTDLRMNKALELLNETDDKTYFIAYKVGYLEPNYFSYVFKKKFGVSPSKYRTGLREGRQYGS